MISDRIVRMADRVPDSSASISPAAPTTSAARIAAKRRSTLRSCRSMGPSVQLLSGLCCWLDEVSSLR